MYFEVTEANRAEKEEDDPSFHGGSLQITVKM
jgi:hypothetical protein